MKRLIRFLILSATVVPFGSPALADREPTTTERAQIDRCDLTLELGTLQVPERIERA